MDATPQDVSSYPTTPFPFQSKHLNWVIELNWENWWWFMLLLLCSDSSSFSLLSNFLRGKISLLSCKAFPDQLFCLRAHEAIRVFLLQVSGRDIIPARGLLRQSLSVVKSSSIVLGLSSVPSGTDHFWVPHWQMNSIFWSVLPDYHHMGFAVDVGATLSATMPDCNYPNQAF